MRIWRTTRLVNIKTETTFAGQIGDGDLMTYRSCVVNSSHQQLLSSLERYKRVTVITLRQVNVDAKTKH